MRPEQDRQDIRGRMERNLERTMGRPAWRIRSYPHQGDQKLPRPSQEGNCRPWLWQSDPTRRQNWTAGQSRS
eukprot:1256995-Heterocapsa_arctica.AAC.1